MFYTLLITNFSFWDTIILSVANVLNFDQSEILSFFESVVRPIRYGNSTIPFDLIIKLSHTILRITCKDGAYLKNNWFIFFAFYELRVQHIIFDELYIDDDTILLIPVLYGIDIKKL